MKKFFRFRSILAMIVLISLLVFTTVAVAGQASPSNRQGNGISWIVQLYSTSTGTTAATTTNYATFDYPMNNVTCDVITSPTVSTGAITVVINGNAGSSTTLFDLTNTALVSSFTVTPSLTLSVMRTVTKAATPFRTISGTITSPTTTAVVTVNCVATQ